MLKSSAFYDAIVYAYGRGAVIAASGAGATVLGDPMVDPRGGAYTVGLGLVPGLAIFPYHGRAADHLRERSVDLLAKDAVLVGVDEQTALIRTGDGPWEVMGAGGATVYRKGAKAKTAKSRRRRSTSPSPRPPLLLGDRHLEHVERDRRRRRRRSLAVWFGLPSRAILATRPSPLVMLPSAE